MSIRKSGETHLTLEPGDAVEILLNKPAEAKLSRKIEFEEVEGAIELHLKLVNMHNVGLDNGADLEKPVKEILRSCTELSALLLSFMYQEEGWS